jgi:serine protease Do
VQPTLSIISPFCRLSNPKNHAAMHDFSARLLARFGRPVGCLCLIAVAWTVLGNAKRAEAAEERRTPIVRAIAGARDSVVNIHGQKTIGGSDDPAAHDSPHRVNGMGTGVIIDERGYILTNYHVVEGVQKIEVTLADGQSFIAQRVSTDPAGDLAVIKISATDKLSVIPIGTSSDLMLGETVIADGNAYGYENTVSHGIISALHRTVQVSDAQGYDDLIQTDAPINPGNSGGPLLNINGQMIGLNVAVRAGAQNIGFAIPVDRAISTASKLMSVERLDNNWHGIVAKDDSTSQPGLTIGSVDKESPAAQVGFKAGDVITAVGKQDVARSLDFERALLGHKPGDQLPVMVRRNDQPVKLILVLATLPQHPAAEADLPWDLLGLRLAPLTATQFKQYQSRYRGGLSVTELRPDSPAAKQGLRRGDVLVGMHIWETVTLDNVNYILNRPDFTELEPVKFYILRGSETLYGHFNVSLQRKITRE